MIEVLKWVAIVVAGGVFGFLVLFLASAMVLNGRLSRQEEERAEEWWH